MSLTRADGTVTASWDAPAGATKYHVTYSSDGMQSWSAAASPADNYSANSITFSADNAKTYVVGVRAGNGNDQWSGWRNSAPIGPFTPDPTPTPAPAPPDAPASVTVTRADGTLTANWPTVSGATKYHVTYTSDNTQSWTSAADSHTGNSITITSADNAKTYIVGVRAGNDGGWSAWRNSPAAGPYLPPPTNFTVTNGDGYFDLAWDAVTGATAYDVRAKINNSASWSSIATGVTTNSYRYTTSAVVNKLAVRATNSNGASAWAELSRMPSGEWLNTVQQSGASAESLAMAAAQAQSQLAAPASITVTRENNPRDEKLYVTWSAVSGASGYNLACASRPPINTPFSSLSWWHCGSITSGSTTTFTVDEDKVSDLEHNRSYTVAVRAVTSDPADASTWVLSTDVHPAYTPDGKTMSVSRAASSISVSWERQIFSQGYEIECATRENNVTGAHTLCADVETQTVVDGKINVTISSWTADGTDYTIDDTKTYDLSVRNTNTWGNSPWVFTPLIHPLPPAVTVSNTGVTAATLTIANHTGNWYYQANTSPDNTCQGPVSGNSKGLTGLSPHTSYIYSAYSDSTCTTANLLATATPFTTLFSSVSNLGSTKHATIESGVHSTLSAGVAFTTGAHAGGYTLKSVTVPLKNKGGTNGVVFDLRAMQGTEQYSSTSEPSDTVLASLSIATPTASTYTDTTVTCSGSGCSLSPSTTYFVTARTSDAHPAYSWAVSTSETETAQPSGNGWSVGFGHYQSNRNPWGSYSDWNIAEITFETVATLTPSNLTATGATLTIAGYPGANWYYKYTSPSGGTCSNAVSGASTTVTMGGGSYTFAAYSDASCSNLLATTIAFSKDATPAAPASVTAVATENKHLSASWQEPTWATKYHVTYTCNNGNDWGLVANGAVGNEDNLTQTGQTVTASADLSGGWWNNQSPQCRMGVRAGNHNGWSSWEESNSVTPQ